MSGSRGGSEAESAGGSRAGVVAILGPPNVGKSTLLNAMLGEKLAIVTRKPQTTRSRILGIANRPGVQLLLLDTPGLHTSERTLNALLIEQARAAADDCDVALLLVELGAPWSRAHADWHAELVGRGTPVLVVGTKLDRPGALEAPWPPPGVDPAQAFRSSARGGEGVEAVVAAAAARLPESPPLYPGDEVSDRPLRFLVAELVREAAFEALEQELPYELAVEVIQYDESREGLVAIRANLIVERNSQKQIVIGRGGSQIKEIGIQARREIEKLVESKVHLELWVKVEPRWSRKPARIKSLGYV